MDRIVFLGTSHGDPSCSRFCSSLCLEFCGRRFLIDAGTPVLALMLRNGLPVSGLDAVFITHMHEDHAGGLPELIKFFLKYVQDCPPVFLPEQGAELPLLAWLKAMHVPETRVPLLRFEHEIPEKTCSFGEVAVNFIPTRHLAGINSPSYAISVSGGGKRLMFTGDLSSDFCDFPLIHGDPEYDLCVAEATHARNAPDKFFAKLKQAPVRRIILNHIGPLWTDGQEYVLQELAERYQCPVEIASDGMRVVV